MKENPSLITCHIPFEGATVEVLVNPNKTYGNETGRALIEQYSRPLKKPSPRFINSIVWDKEKYKGLTVNTEKTIGKGSIQEVLSLPFIKHTPQEIYNLTLSTEFQQSIRIGNSLFDERLICEILEEITHKKIIARHTNKPLKRLVNCTFSLSIIPPEKDNILVILAKGKAYLLAPRIEED